MLTTRFVFLFCMVVASFARGAAPSAPSNLTAKALGVNAFRLEWADNSHNEIGWEILAGLAGDQPTRYTLLASPNATSFVVTTGELPGEQLDFQIRAYNGSEPSLVFSKRTSIASATAFPNSTFGAPTELATTLIGDGSVRLRWKDRSTSESRYLIESKAGSEDWAELGAVSPDTEFNIPVGGLIPGTNYDFRVRAGKGNPEVHTAYSNVANATTTQFRAPTLLVAKAVEDGAFTFQWKDASTAEDGYEIQAKAGSEPYQTLGTTGPNTTRTSPVSGFAFNKTYHFRVRGFRVVNSVNVYSGFSNEVMVKSTSLQKPGNLNVANSGEGTVKVTWTDESDRETNYEIAYREKGTSSFSSSYTAANTGNFTKSDLPPGLLYEMKVRAVDVTSGAFSSFTPLVEIRTKDGIAGDLDPPIFWKTSFFNQIVISRASALSSLEVTGLPAGLKFDPAARTITGKTAAEGVRKVKLKATFNDASVVQKTMVLRIIRPPAAPVKLASFAPVNVAPTATTEVPLAGKFADPDTPAAVRFNTNIGSFDLILYAKATPATVANFLAYCDGSRYQNSFFHRAVNAPESNLVIVQGGGFRHTAGDGFTSVAKFSPVVNEPGISNRRGTVAMAKVSGNPDSGTSEFFVNLDHGNASNLDAQNSGFTAFGRIADGGLAIFDQITAMPVNDYSIIVAGVPQNLTDVPTTSENSSSTLNPDQLVKISSVTRKGALSYRVHAQNPSVATASLAAGRVLVTGVGAGTTNIQVLATDLDGNTVSQLIPVTVP